MRYIRQGQASFPPQRRDALSAATALFRRTGLKKKPLLSKARFITKMWRFVLQYIPACPQNPLPAPSFAGVAHGSFEAISTHELGPRTGKVRSHRTRAAVLGGVLFRENAELRVPEEGWLMGYKKGQSTDARAR